MPEWFPKRPEHLWRCFYQITQIPRPSGEEGLIRDYIVSIAKEKSLPYKVDQAGNIVIYLKATPGYETHPTVLIQNHLDMVCDQLPEKVINFSADPIDTFVEGEWLKAHETTLGADNGIGVAAALAVIFDESIVHPPLELLFTVDEETGLHGALNLDSNLLSAKRMLNLDSEDWGILYVGCAGGFDVEFKKEFEFVKAHSNHVSYELEIKGLRGGHSGIEIHLQQGNAIKLLCEILNDVSDGNLQVASFRGGRAHNIIPRDARVIVNLNPSDTHKLEKSCEAAVSRWRDYLPNEDQELEIKLVEVEKVDSALSREDSKNLLSILRLFPHGAHKYDPSTSEKLVSLSSNLALCILQKGELYILGSARFFNRQEAITLEQSFRALATSFGLEINQGSGYPSWRPQFEGELLTIVKEEYKKLTSEEANITAIHAGLECGIIKDKLGEIDIVSFGPTIRGAHSPTERVFIPSVEKFWILFKNVLKSL
jgi:dipeptidase D